MAKNPKKPQTVHVSIKRRVSANMDWAEPSAKGTTSNSRQEDFPVAALASAVALAAASSLLAWSFLPARKRRVSIAGQISLGVMAACAAVVAWNKRQQEIDAARHLFTHIHEVRDARWLKKHPVAYG
jgi:ABC-type enterobactin transport system permease subunit